MNLATELMELVIWISILAIPIITSTVVFKRATKNKGLLASLVGILVFSALVIIWIKIYHFLEIR